MYILPTKDNAPIIILIEMGPLLFFSGQSPRQVGGFGSYCVLDVGSSLAYDDHLNFRTLC